MKKFLLLIFILLFSFPLFCQHTSFNDIKTNYEKLITHLDLSSLRNFSTVLDLYSQSPEYNSLKKHPDYEKTFSELNKTTKHILNTFENPWIDAKNENQEVFSTRLIDEKIYFFIITHNTYVTKKMIFYRVFFSISGAVLAFIFILILFLQNQRKEKHKNLLFTKAMLEGQESERKRISEELHDTIAQNLKAEKFLILETIENYKNGQITEENLNEILEKSKSNIIEIRSICQNLFPPDFEKQNLDWIIAELCHNIKKTSGIKCSYLFDSESPFAKMKTKNKLNLFRIIQEAVNNAVNHSGCTEIQISITKKEVLISDNGTGFDFQKELLYKQDHFGLRSMKERASLLGSSLEIVSSEKGTTIHLKCFKEKS